MYLLTPSFFFAWIFHTWIFNSTKFLCTCHQHCHTNQVACHQLQHQPGGVSSTLPHQPGGVTPTLPHQPAGVSWTLPHQPGGVSPTLPHQPGGEKCSRKLTMAITLGLISQHQSVMGWKLFELRSTIPLIWFIWRNALTYFNSFVLSPPDMIGHHLFY